MSFKRFKSNEIITNTMRASPQCNFTIVDGVVYYNERPAQAGIRNSTVRNVAYGHISLYEYNIDRPYRPPVESETYQSYLFPWDYDPGSGPDAPEPDTRIPDTGRIFPWISKDSAGASWKTVGKTSYNNEFHYGDILLGTYPLAASITIEKTEYAAYDSTASYNAHYVALRNTLTS